jgi:hypothetical protein
MNQIKLNKYFNSNINNKNIQNNNHYWLKRENNKFDEIILSFDWKNLKYISINLISISKYYK